MCQNDAEALEIIPTFQLLAHSCILQSPKGQILPIQPEFLLDSTPILAQLTGKLPSMSSAISRAPLTTSLSTSHHPPLNKAFITYSDADHGGNPDNGKSTGGYGAKIGSGAVSWSSKLQPMVTLSTTEAEHISAVEAAKQIFGCTSSWGVWL